MVVQDLNTFKELLEEYGLKITDFLEKKDCWKMAVIGKISSSSLKLIAQSFKFTLHYSETGGIIITLKKVV